MKIVTDADLLTFNQNLTILSCYLVIAKHYASHILKNAIHASISESLFSTMTILLTYSLFGRRGRQAMGYTMEFCPSQSIPHPPKGGEGGI